MFRKLVLAIVATAIGAGLTVPAQTAFAQVKKARHDMASGPGVWRVELRDFYVFKGTLDSVDPKGKDEIHSIEVKLENEFSPFGVSKTHQFHSVKEHSRNMSSRIGVGNKAYVKRYRFDNVWWLKQPRKVYNLWIHTKQYVEQQGGEPVIFFAINVATRELDCVRQRICNRGSNGTRTHLFTLPLPKVKSSRCIAGNTYRFDHVRDDPDDRHSWSLVLTSMADPNDKRVIPASERRSAPDLFVKEGEICIASTSK